MLKNRQIKKDLGIPKFQPVENGAVSSVRQPRLLLVLSFVKAGVKGIVVFTV